MVVGLCGLINQSIVLSLPFSEGDEKGMQIEPNPLN